MVVPRDLKDGRMTNATNVDKVSRTEFLGLVQRYVANVGISGSSLRNQGAKGVVEAARRFLAGLDLNRLREMEPAKYSDWLEKVTCELRDSLPKAARSWGAARKAVNIFMCHAFLNRELSATYDLIRFGEVMETPLDGGAAEELRKEELRQRAGEGSLPPWPGVGDLESDVSRKYQDFASVFAKQKGVPRACLDLVLWRHPSTTVRSRNDTGSRGIH
jgi:hypothetical protein